MNIVNENFYYEVRYTRQHTYSKYRKCEMRFYCLNEAREFYKNIKDQMLDKRFINEEDKIDSIEKFIYKAEERKIESKVTV